MKYRLLKLTIIALLAGVILPGMINEILAVAATRVNVSKMTLIEAEHILLGKIAKIEGDDQSLINRLSGIVIGRSPLPGKTREIEASVVKRRLKQNRIDPEQLVLHIPPQVFVERSFIEINPEKIKALVSDYISKNLINNLNDASIKDIRVSESLNLPGGRITYTVKPSSNSDMMGKIPFTVSFDVNGKFYKSVWATATVEIFTHVVVTKKPLGRHKPITEDDIEMQKMDLAKLPSDVITDPAVILGQRTRRAIGSQTVLRPNLVEFPPLLKRGDVVVIIVETGGFKITALGQVKKKGRLGERIPVINLDSKKVLYARVLDSNTVKVEF
jgi:flagella basal body P-ring formation protein FlgA